MLENMVYFGKEVVNVRTFRVVRKIDKLGRIVVPKDMRDFYKIDIDTPLEIVAVEDGILIRVESNEKK